jgi:hypothetical protein
MLSTRRDSGREGEVVLHSKKRLSWAKAGIFFDCGWAGLYWETALRKTGGEVAVYTKHQEPKQAGKQTPQAKQNTIC